MSSQPDSQPPLGVKSARRHQRPPHHRRHRPSHLSWGNSLRQHVAQRHLSQQLKRSAPVSDRPPHHRICAIRRNHPLLHRRVSSRTSNDTLFHRCPPGLLATHYIHQVQQERLNDKRVVVVPMKVRPIAVSPISEIPALVLPQRVVHACPVPVFAQRKQACLNHCRKQQPVVEPGQ